MNKKVNKKELDDIQLEYLAKAEALQNELIALGFMATRIEKGDDRTTFNVIFFDGSHDYEIRKGWDNKIYLYRTPYVRYEHVENSQRYEIENKYKKPLGNMQVMSAKKVQARIDAENAAHAELEALNNENATKKGSFLARIKALEATKQYLCRYQYDRDTQAVTGGWIERNGIELFFEINAGGYIHKRLTVQQGWKEEGRDDIADFVALSDNKYRDL